MHIINQNIFPYGESVIEGNIVLAKNDHKPVMSFAAMVQLPEGLCVIALLTLKVQSSLICFVAIQITIELKMKWQFI
jgi:hypothetical protein